MQVKIFQVTSSHGFDADEGPAPVFSTLDGAIDFLNELLGEGQNCDPVTIERATIRPWSSEGYRCWTFADIHEVGVYVYEMGIEQRAVARGC